MFQRLFQLLAPERKRSAAASMIALHTAGRPVWTPRNYAALAQEGFAGNPMGYRAVRMIAEAAVIGAADELKGQVPVVFATLKSTVGVGGDRRAAAEAMMRQVTEQLGAVARPARVYVVDALPKTRSGKLLRRSLQALVESRDPGDLSTLDDPMALEAIRAALLRGPDMG
jgi:hypothetical protein